MQNIQRRQKLVEFVQAALECSIHLSPRNPGLTREELFEIGKRANFEEGEIGDALAHAGAQAHFGDPKLKLRSLATSSEFHFHEEPDYRNVAAFDLVVKQLQALARSHGAANAQLDRSVIVERAVAQNLPEREVEAAITIMIMDGHLVEKGGVLRLAPGREMYPLASEQIAQVQGTRAAGMVVQKEARRVAYPIVKDVIERRNDGRPRSAEPLDAFADALEKLGYAPFRLWWKQTVSELRHGDTSISPVTVSVLAAALVEGALTFVVKHARGLSLGVMGSKSFDQDPRTWKIDDLVSSASAGQGSAILDNGAKQRADALIRTRQRIHAGRMLSDFPGGVTDLRPEEARASKETAELVVRCVLDWLEKYPPK